MKPSIIKEKGGRGVLKVILNRPERHNAFDQFTISELTETFSAIGEDIRAVIISGKGKSFCAGADLNWMKSTKNYSEEENREDAQKMAQMFAAINACPVPLLAAVNGVALGGGAGLLAVCDFVVASEDVKIGFTEVRLGLLPAVISPYVVAKIGESAARAYLTTGTIFGIEEALAMGLVHQIAGVNCADYVGNNVIDKFLEAAPGATREAKVLISNIVKGTIPDGDSVTDYTCKTTARIRVGKEAQEGMSAFLNKKKFPWIPEEK